jgi:serine/threonine protein kinase
MTVTMHDQSHERLKELLYEAIDLAPDVRARYLTLAGGHLFERRFRLLRRLGVGGMGQVWLADQTEPVRRQVAVKLIRAGRYDETSVKRFETERRSLAIMNHPGIARVLAEYCDQHCPKIIDFGIAKRLVSDATCPDAPTLFGQLIGTPGFMSPEHRHICARNPSSP